MIYEFALDPSLAALWSDPREFMRYRGKFGIGTARVMCRVPKNHWRKLVWEAFESLAAGLDDAKKQARRKNLDAILSSSLDAGTSRRSCSLGPAWTELAKVEHERRPFHGLLVAETAPADRSGLPVLRDPDFDQEQPPWSEEHGLVPRHPEALATALSPVLAAARQVRIVEPHFAPAVPRWRETILRLLERAVLRKRNDEFPDVEIHTCVTRRVDLPRLEEQTEAEQRAKARRLADDLNKLIPGLPVGLRLTVYFWAERPKGKEFHDRFLLTDVGGLQLGKGFDADSEETTRDEAITLVARRMLGELRARYSRTSSDFDERGSRTIERVSRPVR